MIKFPETMCEFTLERMKQWLTLFAFIQILPGALSIHAGRIFDVCNINGWAAVFILIGILTLVGSLLLMAGSMCQKFNYLMTYFIFCGWLLMVLFGLLIYFIVIWSIYVDSFVPNRASIQLLEYFKGRPLTALEIESSEGTGVFLFFSLGLGIICYSISVLISILILFHPKLKNKNLVYCEKSFKNICESEVNSATPIRDGPRNNEYGIVGNIQAPPNHIENS